MTLFFIFYAKFIPIAFPKSRLSRRIDRTIIGFFKFQQIPIIVIVAAVSTLSLRAAESFVSF